MLERVKYNKVVQINSSVVLRSNMTSDLPSAAVKNRDLKLKSASTEIKFSVLLIL